MNTAYAYRYHLSGAKAGTVDVFVDNLPGIPDNISPSASGGYWVAFALVRSSMLDSLTTLPSIRNLIVKVRLWDGLSETVMN